MMREIGQEELRRMPLRRPWEYQAQREKPELDWLERHPALAAVAVPLMMFGSPVLMIAILYWVGKARGM